MSPDWSFTIRPAPYFSLSHILPSPPNALFFSTACLRVLDDLHASFLLPPPPFRSMPSRSGSPVGSHSAFLHFEGFIIGGSTTRAFVGYMAPISDSQPSPSDGRGLALFFLNWPLLIPVERWGQMLAVPPQAVTSIFSVLSPFAGRCCVFRS